MDYDEAKKRAAKLLARFRKNMVDSWDDAMQFLIDYDCETGDLGIVDEDYIDTIISEQAKEWGYQRVACFLYGIMNCLNEDYYHLDGYGNLEPITNSDIDCWLSDIASYGD